MDQKLIEATESAKWRGTIEAYNTIIDNVAVELQTARNSLPMHSSSAEYRGTPVNTYLVQAIALLVKVQTELTRADIALNQEIVELGAEEPDQEADTDDTEA